MRQFTPDESTRLADLLNEAFDPESLEMVLYSRLGRRYKNLAPAGKTFDYQLYKVIERANMENWNLQLLNATASARPGNGELQLLVQQVGLLGISDQGLQALVSKTGFQDATKLLTRLCQIFGQVCRIEIQGEQEGTGFLVGPDLLLTNYHVARKFIKTPALTTQVIARFDYRSLENSPAVYGGTTVALAANNAVLDYKEFDKVDTDLNYPPTTPVPEDKLDYALLRLASPIGKEPGGPRIAGQRPEGEEARGWIKYPNPVPEMAPSSPLIIVQHPSRRPLEIAFESNAVIGTDPNGVRLRYNVNTEGGSSGSPCFNEKWQWVALHHYGSLARDYNQGVPVAKIIAALPEALRAELTPENL